MDIAMTNNDINIAENGDIAICINKTENIIQQANSILRTRKGGNEFHIEYGNNVRNNRIKNSDGGHSDVAMYCTNAILTNIIDAVSVKISSIEVNEDDGYSYTVRYSITMKNGDIIDCRSII